MKYGKGHSVGLKPGHPLSPQAGVPAHYVFAFAPCAPVSAHSPPRAICLIGYTAHCLSWWNEPLLSRTFPGKINLSFYYNATDRGARWQMEGRKKRKSNHHNARGHFGSIEMFWVFLPSGSMAASFQSNPCHLWWMAHWVLLYKRSCDCTEP